MRDAEPFGSRTIASACCSTEDVMIQLNEAYRPADDRSDRTDIDLQPCPAAPADRTTQNVSEAEEAMPFVSPPPVAWPRVFPQL
jgi:hypothetical protein